MQHILRSIRRRQRFFFFFQLWRCSLSYSLWVPLLLEPPLCPLPMYHFVCPVFTSLWEFYVKAWFATLSQCLSNPPPFSSCDLYIDWLLFSGLQISSFLILSCHLILKILLRQLFTTTCRFYCVVFVTLHVSETWSSTVFIVVLSLLLSMSLGHSATVSASVFYSKLQTSSYVFFLLPTFYYDV